MTPLSRWQLSKKEEDLVTGLFLNELLEITDKTEMKSLLKALLSDSEFLMIAKRLVAFVFIDEAYTDMEIAKILHVTRATAIRFRLTYRLSKEKKEPVVKIVEKIRKSENLKEVLKNVLFKYAIPMALGKKPRFGLYPRKAW